jgi:acetolactate synthase-1/2/3 large subunit
VPTRHPLAIGVPGSYSAPPANQIVHGADLVLYAGCDTGDQVTLNWTVPSLATKIVQIDADPVEIGRSYPITIGVLGDPKASLLRLAEALGRPARDRGFAEAAARIVADWRAAMAPLCTDDGSPVRVERLCAELGSALPADGILVAETGYSGIWTGTLVDFNGTGQTYLRAAGSLGWSFPAALGAQCAAPSRKVVCFTGDGGFYYHLPELETARRCGIPVTVVVNNNSGFGQNLSGVRRIAGNRPGRGEALVRFGPTDFAAVARSFGVRGIRVEQPAELALALRQALAAGEPVVVDVVTGIEPRAPEPWAPAEADRFPQPRSGSL